MNEPKAVQEIHKIREKIYDETKNMTSAEQTKFTSEIAKKVIVEYNLNVQYERNTHAERFG
jgi:predicted RNase H-related nuclease YkuK (DUF458 family)